MRVFPAVAMILLLVHAARAAEPASSSPWKAGAAAVRITPKESVWLTGFGARTKPSQGTLHELYAKALALEDASGRRAVLVTSDLLGFPRSVADAICTEALERHGLPRDRILLNASHTHGAPALASPAQFIYGPRASPEQQRAVEAYTRELERNVVDVIGAAIKNLEPADLAFGTGEARFGVNRRKVTAEGVVQGFTPNPDGPVDHGVPVLRVRSERGRTLAVVFGYAAHPTTITAGGGRHYYEFSGDFATFAQQTLEAEQPGTVALFVQGCGGDVMVSPRGTVELAREYGQQLSRAVRETLEGPLRPVGGPLNCAFDTVQIDFAAPPTREALQRQADAGDVYHRWHAREMLGRLDRDGALPKDYPYPLQAWRLGRDLTLVAMAGEVVADYGLRLRRELGPEPLWVAGYSNDLCSYIPSRRVLAEGGYEADRSMIYYMHPGPWAPSVEDAIVTKVRELVARVRAE